MKKRKVDFVDVFGWTIIIGFASIFFAIAIFVPGLIWRRALVALLGVGVIFGGTLIYRENRQFMREHYGEGKWPGTKQ